MREEANSIKSIVSFSLIFFLLVPVMKGELDHFHQANSTHIRTIIKKQDDHTRQGAHFPHELTGKQEENRTKKSTHQSFTSIKGEWIQYPIHGLSNFFIVHIQVSTEDWIKVPRYIRQRSLLF